MSAPLAATASTFSDLYDFGTWRDGSEPIRSVIYRDGALYGSVQQGGNKQMGMLYKFDLATATETPIYSFRGGAEGQYPASNLVSIKRNLYGTNYSGGTANKGSIYRYKVGSNKAHLLYSFQGSADGGNPTDVTPVDGVLYGTCVSGGAGFGVVFKFDPATKQVSTVYQFTGGDDGALPYGGVISAGGLLYGTTNVRGASNAGTVYSIDPATGAQTTVYTFNGTTDGASPSGTLTYAKGLLYGTTSKGGANGFGAVFSLDPATGKETVLHSFAGIPDGSWPVAQLTYLNGDLYGTASQGGNSSNLGTIFKVNAATGDETTLHTFTGSGVDGGASTSSLYLHDGTLYGTASLGGAHGGGVLFSLTP